MSDVLEKVRAAGNEISALFEKYELSEIESILVLESVKMSFQISIMRKSGAFVLKDGAAFIPRLFDMP